MSRPTLGYSELAHRAERRAKFNLIAGRIMLALAVAFLALFLIVGFVTGRWPWLTLTSVFILTSSGLGMLMTVGMEKQTAATYRRLSGCEF